jgi:hypothetical protein
MSALKIGDIVHLKSGSGMMTVENIHHQETQIDVVWCSSSRGLERATLPIACIKEGAMHDRLNKDGVPPPRPRRSKPDYGDNGEK